MRIPRIPLLLLPAGADLSCYHCCRVLCSQKINGVVLHDSVFNKKESCSDIHLYTGTQIGKGSMQVSSPFTSSSIGCEAHGLVRAFGAQPRGNGSVPFAETTQDHGRATSWVNFAQTTIAGAGMRLAKWLVSTRSIHTNTLWHGKVRRDRFSRPRCRRCPTMPHDQPRLKCTQV